MDRTRIARGPDVDLDRRPDASPAPTRRRSGAAPVFTDGPLTTAVAALDPVSAETTRIQRSTTPPLRTERQLSRPRIRSVDRSPVVRRVISDEVWTGTVTPKLIRGITVTLFRPDGKPIAVKQVDGQLQALGGSFQSFTTLKAAQLAQIKAACTLTPAHLGGVPSYAATESPGKGFKVTSFENEPLSLVHQTESTGGDKNPHLTVENAHVLMFEDMFSGPTRDVRSKVGEDKATINTALGAYGVGTVDNLNFYLPEGKTQKHKQQKKKDPSAHEEMPLSSYLAFIVHALNVGGAPAEYGERIAGLANRMAQDKGLATAGLFLRAGMDEPAFVRAVLIIDSVLPAPRKLAISAEARRVFARWWSVGGNTDKFGPDREPYLPTSADEGAELVRSGSPQFRKLEPEYCNHYFGHFVHAVNAFRSTPVLEVLPANQ